VTAHRQGDLSDHRGIVVDTTAADAPAPAASARPGAITLVRHGEPDISRKVRLSADEYRDWWASYETKGLLAGQTPPADLLEAARRAGTLISSIRPRAIETAAAVCAGRACAQDPLFVEAPLPPPRWPSWIRLSPKVWGFLTRFWWWWFNHHEDEESRAQAETRADAAAVMLIDFASGGEDVLVVAHGFFNAMVGEALKRRGWRIAKDQGFNYWKARRFVRS
jgi:broad specificity phosphatase PhoE